MQLCYIYLILYPLNCIVATVEKKKGNERIFKEEGLFTCPS